MKTFVICLGIFVFVVFAMLAYKMPTSPSQPDPAMVELSKITANTPQELERMAWEFEQNGGKRKDFVDYVKRQALETRGAAR